MINNYQQNPFYPQLLQTLQNMTPMQQSITPLPQQQQEVIKVNGRPGAEAYQMGANSSVLMLDMTASIVWLAMTDSAGYKTLQAYDIIPHEEAKQEDALKSLEERIKKLEERVNNGKSYTADAKQQRKSEQQ